MRETSRGEDKELHVNNYCAGIVPTKELEGEMQDQNMALVARMLSKLFRIVTGPASKNKCTMIFINQVRATMNQYSPEESCGGKALKFYASTRVRMGKVKLQAGDPLTAEEGIKVNCSVLKNRFCNGGNPYTKCSYYARYNMGIDNLATFPNMLIKYNVAVQKAAWIRVENEEGDVETILGVPCKWNGKNAFLDVIRQNEGLRKELEKRLNDKMLGITKADSLSEEEINIIKKEEASTPNFEEEFGIDSKEATIV